MQSPEGLQHADSLGDGVLAIASMKCSPRRDCNGAEQEDEEGMWTPPQ